MANYYLTDNSGNPITTTSGQEILTSVQIQPNVPVAPGVPPLLRTGSIFNPDVALVTSDVLSALGGFFIGPQWGIFDDDGNPLVIGDSVVAFDFKDESRVSDYPVENGGFASYNKVVIPYEPRMTFTKGGTDADRAAFLASVAALKTSLQLVTAVTPEVTYPSVNVVHYDYRRTSTNGATLLTVDVWMEEIRVVSAGSFTDTKSPDGATTQNGGTVTPSTPTAAQSTTATANDAGNQTAPFSTSAFA